MKHDFLDKYAGLNTVLHRLDPRSKIIAFTFSLIMVVSETKVGEYHFVVYYLILAILIIISKVSLIFILKRTLMTSPFIIITAASIPFSFWLTNGFIDNNSITLAILVILKALFAIILLTLLTSIEKFHILLAGFRKLKMPALFGIISAMMYRYIFILIDELHRTRFARESRSPGNYVSNRFKIYGNQAAVIFIRSWNRADMVYQSMLARGFNGTFPEMKNLNFKLTDSIFVMIIILTFSMIRLL